jgi:hypothetical protein
MRIQTGVSFLLSVFLLFETVWGGGGRALFGDNGNSEQIEFIRQRPPFIRSCKQCTM